MIVDIVRAYEGLLLGLVIVVVAAIFSGAGSGLSAFAAVVSLPALLMLAFMHLGSPPRELYLFRAAGALVGWGLGWGAFIPVAVLVAYVALTTPSWTVIYVAIAIVDGVLVGLCIAAADRLGRRMRRRSTTET